MDEYIKRSDMRAALEKASINPRFADEPPAADVEPVRHGRWKLENTMDSAEDKLYCSECKWVAHVGRGSYNARTPYCPNCGAKMDEEVAQDG